MGQDECIFCRMAAGGVPTARVYEDDVVLAFLDIGPLSDGHTLLIPKQHYARIDDCPDDVLASFCSRLGRVARAVVAAVEAEGYNILCNNGRAAGQLVEHVHFHIIPRRGGDGVFTSWPAYRYPPGRIEALAKMIREHL